MKLFISHSSKDKALVREFTRSFPNYFHTWLDERELIAGTPIAETLNSVIVSDMFYLILFVSENSQKSDWVRQEIESALEKEIRIGRPFVIPVLLDDIWGSIEPESLRLKKYVSCFTQDEATVKTAASVLVEEITKLVVAFAESASQGFLITHNKITNARKEDLSFMIGLSDVERSNLKTHMEEDGSFVIAKDLWLFKLTPREKPESFDVIYKGPSGIKHEALGTWNMVRKYFLEWTKGLRNAQQ